LRYVGYVVSLGSSFGTPNRQIGYETARDPKDGVYYE
jgi:hypothetical protein